MLVQTNSFSSIGVDTIKVIVIFIFLGVNGSQSSLFDARIHTRTTSLGLWKASGDYLALLGLSDDYLPGL